MTKQRFVVRLRLPPHSTRSYGIIDTKHPVWQFDLFESKSWNSGFFNALGFCWKSKKARQNLAFISRNSLILATHCLSCIFITNLFWLVA